MIKDYVGTRIKELRAEKGLSQENLALKAGLDRIYFASIERGKRNIPIVNLGEIVNSSDTTLVNFFRNI